MAEMQTKWWNVFHLNATHTETVSNQSVALLWLLIQRADSSTLQMLSRWHNSIVGRLTALDALWSLVF